MTEQPEYREVLDLNSVLLCKNDLLELEKIVVDDPETDEIKISLEFDSTQINANSFKELLSRDDLPISTDKLNIRMSRWIRKEGYRRISCGVRLRVHFKHVSCHIHSPDQTWFLGKKSQIENFVRSKRPWYFFINKIAPWVIGLITLTTIFYCIYLFKEKQFYEMILPIASYIILVTIGILTFTKKLFPFVKIYLQENTKRKFGFYELCALIGALAGLATIAQFLIVLFK